MSQNCRCRPTCSETCIVEAEAHEESVSTRRHTSVELECPASRLLFGCALALQVCVAGCVGPDLEPPGSGRSTSTPSRAPESASGGGAGKAASDNAGSFGTPVGGSATTASTPTSGVAAMAGAGTPPATTPQVAAGGSANTAGAGATSMGNPGNTAGAAGSTSAHGAADDTDAGIPTAP